METAATDDELLYLLALTKAPGVGPVTARNLVAWCKGARQVFAAPKEQLLRIPDIGESTVRALKSAEPLREAEAEISACRANGVEPVPFTSADFPAPLKVIHNAPLVLFIKGRLPLNSVLGTAVVGTRKPTPYGKMWAARFAEAFALRGLNVVSGLAYGIDGEAHRATLQVGGLTTAVLAHGFDRIYPPAHADLARRILDGGGALVTEYPWGAKLDPSFFPQRNRIIAGLSRAVVIVEAAEKGGALITAQFAFEQDREVYAVPGALGARASEGCNELIRRQVAQLVTSPEQVIVALEEQIEKLQPNLFTAPLGLLSAEEQQVVNALEQRGMSIDEMAEKLSIAPGRLFSLLLELEFKGLVEQQPGRRFRRR